MRKIALHINQLHFVNEDRCVYITPFISVAVGFSPSSSLGRYAAFLFPFRSTDNLDGSSDGDRSVAKQNVP